MRWRFPRAFWIVSLLQAGVLLASPGAKVRAVRVEGNLRIPAATVLHHTTLAPNSEFDPAILRTDIEKLYNLGVFRKISVRLEELDEHRVDVVYHLEEYPFVSSFEIEGVKEPLEEKIHRLLREQKLDIRPSMPFQPVTAKKAVSLVRAYLHGQEYPNAEVALIEDRRGDSVRITLLVRPGPKIGFGKVEFTGNDSISDEELIRQMTHILSGKFPVQPVPDTSAPLAKDLDGLRRFYQSRGFARVAIGDPEVRVCRSHPGWSWLPVPRLFGREHQVTLLIPVIEGPPYRLVAVRGEGDGKAASEDIATILGSIPLPMRFDLQFVEAVRRSILTALGNHGYALAEVEPRQTVDDALHTVEVNFGILAGDPVTVGQVRFEGNNHLRDGLLRRHVTVREGEVFDSRKLDNSLDRLNRGNLVQEIGRSDVGLIWDDADKSLDVTFRLRERDRHGVFGTGGTGGLGGGYLGVLYTAFNLLGLGESLALELDGGAAQSNVMMNLAAQRFLGSPFLLAFSVFHRYANVNVAGIVPGPEDLVSLFRRKSGGAGLAGAYEVTRSLRAGLGFQLERDVIEEEADPFHGNSGETRHIRSEWTPFLSFDDTSGFGPHVRGQRLALGHTFSAEGFPGPVRANRSALGFERYFNDPWTSGRNSFAWNIRAERVRSPRGGLVPLEQRLFPGNETVRGFKRGSLTSWARVEGVGPRAAGADTLAAASAEYRVPIRGRLSGAAFMDLAWTRMGAPGSSAESDEGGRLIQETNGLLRASIGGELRFQLPVVRRPARMIFAWNPLRLDSLIDNGASSTLRLADPRGAVRFALGNVFE